MCDERMVGIGKWVAFTESLDRDAMRLGSRAGMSLKKKEAGDND